MDCIRRILLINIMTLVLFVIASGAIAGNGGGGHHMSKDSGNMEINQGTSNQRDRQEYDQHTQNNDMHNDSRGYMMNDIRTPDDMRKNIPFEQKHDYGNDAQKPGHAMDTQQNSHAMEIE